MQTAAKPCPCGDSQRRGADEVSFMGSIFSSKMEVSGGSGGGWTVLGLDASLHRMRKKKGRVQKRV